MESASILPGVPILSYSDTIQKNVKIPHQHYPGIKLQAHNQPLPFDDGLPGIPFQAYSNSQSQQAVPVGYKKSGYEDGDNHGLYSSDFFTKTDDHLIKKPEEKFLSFKNIYDENTLQSKNKLKILDPPSELYETNNDDILSKMKPDNINEKNSKEPSYSGFYTGPSFEISSPFAS